MTVVGESTTTGCRVILYLAKMFFYVGLNMLIEWSVMTREMEEWGRMEGQRHRKGDRKRERERGGGGVGGRGRKLRRGKEIER